MTTNNLDNVSPNIKIKNEGKSVIIDTFFSFTKVLTPNIQEKFNTPSFLLHDTLESVFIEITRDTSTFVMHIMCEESKKEENRFEPYFSESVLFDQTEQCNYNLEPDNEDPSYASCIILNNTDLNETRLLVFTFTIKHIKYHYDNIIPTRLDLYKRLEKIFFDKKLTDIRFNVKGKEFSVHRAIIARCPTLSEMIKNNPYKKNRNFIDITDTEPEIFEIILKYLYLGETGEIDLSENKNEYLFNLILAADFYQIFDLKNKLIDIAIKHLNVKNVLDNFIFAEKFNILNLKQVCMNFLGIYGKAVCDTPLFQELINIHPKLSAELLLFILQY